MRAKTLSSAGLCWQLGAEAKMCVWKRFADGGTAGPSGAGVQFAGLPSSGSCGSRKSCLRTKGPRG